MLHSEAWEEMPGRLPRVWAAVSAVLITKKVFTRC